MAAFDIAAPAARCYFVAALAILFALVFRFAALDATTESADARARTNHQRLLGDEPCNMPAPSPSPR
jgi:hypothetical protein